MSEFGVSDSTGMELAQTIIEDVSYLQVEAWILWQVLDRLGTSWGVLNFDASPSDPNRGQATWLYYSYFVFAQFTRFIDSGSAIVSTDQPDHAARSACRR